MRIPGLFVLSIWLCVYAVGCAPDDEDRCGDDLRYSDGGCYPLKENGDAKQKNADKGSSEAPLMDAETGDGGQVDSGD